MNKIFNLQPIVDSLVDSEKSLITPLIKLNLFGRLVKNEKLITYATNELKGYDNSDTLPDYRISHARLMVQLQAGLHNHERELPISMIANNAGNALEKFLILDSIVTVENMAAQNARGGNNKELALQLPMETLHLFQEPAQKLYRSDTPIKVVKASTVTNAKIINEIPVHVRTNLLEFVIAIAEEFNYEIEIDKFNSHQKENNESVAQQVYNIIYNTGDGAIVNTGSEVSLSAEQNVEKHS